MHKIPDSYFKGNMLASYILLIPLYAFFFLIGKDPADRGRALNAEGGFIITPFYTFSRFREEEDTVAFHHII